MSQLDDVLSEVDTATTQVASELESLRSAVESGDGAAAARLQPLADRLRAIAADPNNPVPAAPTTPTDPNAPATPTA